jgi:hypothetical protein
MNAEDCKNHMKDILDQLSYLLFHRQTLEREIELLKPMFESQIIQLKTRRISNLSKEDINIDVIPVNIANLEVVQKRKSFYYGKIELAETDVEITAKKELYLTYLTHLQQDLQKQAKPCTNDMIFDAVHKAQALKNLNDTEKEVMKNITTNLMKTLNSGNERRIELLETLQNIINQHGE